VRAVLERARAVAGQHEAGALAHEGLDALVDEIRRADLQYLLAEIPAALEQTLAGVERVSGIVRAMREASHPGQEPVNVDINRAIGTSIKIASHEWKDVCEVVTDLDPALPPVLSLPGEIHELILNLLVNAVHAVADVPPDEVRPRRVTIVTRPQSDAVEIRVADTGTGIPAHVRGRIFEPFFTTKNVGRGSGQGLPLVHTIVVQKHRGRLWFETSVGRGTTFYVQLPLERRNNQHAHRDQNSLC
jgi:signal transduction histidine kinase